jgi:hypothetical protein
MKESDPQIRRAAIHRDHLAAPLLQVAPLLGQHLVPTRIVAAKIYRHAVVQVSAAVQLEM